MISGTGFRLRNQISHCNEYHETVWKWGNMLLLWFSNGCLWLSLSDIISHVQDHGFVFMKSQYYVQTKIHPLVDSCFPFFSIVVRWRWSGLFMAQALLGFDERSAFAHAAHLSSLRHRCFPVEVNYWLTPWSSQELQERSWKWH